MRTIDADIQAMLADGRVVKRDAILFDLPEGLFGFWGGGGTFSWNGIDFVGSGEIIRLDPVDFDSAGSPTEISCKLSAIPDSELTPDVIGEIWTYKFAHRPVTLYQIYFNPDTRALVSDPLPFWRGYIGQVEEIDQPGGEFSLSATFISRALDNRRTGHRRRSNEDQFLLQDGDLFFEHAVNDPIQPIVWGREG